MHSAIISKNGNISLNINGKVFNYNGEHPQYSEVMLALNENNESKLSEIVNRKDKLAAASKGKISYIDGIVRWNGSKVENAVSRRIVELDNQGHNVDFILKFLEKCYLNPDPTVVDRLYLFLENACIHISPEGDIIGYKKIRSDNYDFYSGKFLYAVGRTVKMDRSLCNSNSFDTCAPSLHLGSLNYAQNFHRGQGKIIIGKCDPKNVVCIPEEGSYGKLRACEIEVLAEYTEENLKSVAYNDFSLRRDSRGRFVKGNQPQVKRDSKGRFQKIA
jgi:hypothetical protein